MQSLCVRLNRILGSEAMLQLAGCSLLPYVAACGVVWKQGQKVHPPVTALMLAVLRLGRSRVATREPCHTSTCEDVCSTMNRSGASNP